MRNNIKRFIIVLLLMMTLCFAACGDENNDQSTEASHASSASLVGTWKGTGNEISTLTLGDDGSYKDVADDVYVNGTYTVDTATGTLTVNESEYGLVFTYSYELTEDNLTLQLKGGLPRTFVKQ